MYNINNFSPLNISYLCKLRGKKAKGEVNKKPQINEKDEHRKQRRKRESNKKVRMLINYKKDQEDKGQQNQDYWMLIKCIPFPNFSST